MDRLSALLQRFELRARAAHRGRASGALRFDAAPGSGHLHLLRQGRLSITGTGIERLRVGEPSVVLFASTIAHRVNAGPAPGAELVSAVVDFGGADDNPLLRALPLPWVVPLSAVGGLDLTLESLFNETLHPRCGHGAVVDRLVEVLLVQLLRHAIERRLVDGGLMAGLADPRLHKAIAALHAEPSRAWTLASMAAEAGMSRARFAAHFVRQVGMPPGEYLTTWRLGLARSMLRRGLPVKQVADEVGYASASALGRVFTQRLGSPPVAWLRQAG